GYPRHGAPIATAPMPTAFPGPARPAGPCAGRNPTPRAAAISRHARPFPAASDPQPRLVPWPPPDAVTQHGKFDGSAKAPTVALLMVPVDQPSSPLGRMVWSWMPMF